ncbi:MAG: MarR family winged helix-turn-helix transcriptional regulator [Bacteroidota bacterium]
MRLEDAIKQKKFDNEYEKAVVNILFTASWLESSNLQRMKPFGITSQQYNVLRILRGSHPNKLMLNDIACRMIDKNSNATRLVEKLRLKKLVTREQNKENRRQVDIAITPLGLDLLAAIDKVSDDWFNKFNTLNNQEIKQLNTLLDKLRG